VCTAPKPQTFYRATTSLCDRLDMIEFEQIPAGTAPAVRGDVGALALIPFPDRAPDRCRYVAGSRGGPALESSARILIRLAPSSTELLSLELSNESAQCPIEHLGDVTARDHMAQQLLGVSQLVVSAPRNRNLDQIALLRRLALGSINMPQGMLGRAVHCLDE